MNYDKNCKENLQVVDMTPSSFCIKNKKKFWSTTETHLSIYKVISVLDVNAYAYEINRI